MDYRKHPRKLNPIKKKVDPDFGDNIFNNVPPPSAIEHTNASFVFRPLNKIHDAHQEEQTSRCHRVRQCLENVVSSSKFNIFYLFLLLGFLISCIGAGSTN